MSHLVARLSACAVLLVSTARASDLPWQDLGHGLAGQNGIPVLTGQGAQTAGGPVGIQLSGGAPSSIGILVVGFSRVDLPFAGGTLVPFPDVVVQPIPLDANGGFALGTNWPAGAPVGIDTWYQTWILDAAGPQGYSASNALKATTADGPQPGTFPAHWINGVPCAGETPIQIHAYNPDFYILRQSVCTNFEAPFVYLIFGTQKVLMLDSGAGNIQIGNAVYGIINDWLVAHNQASIQLIVAHTHSHGDHVAGDSQFTGKPNTTLVGKTQAQVAAFFGITSWPTQIVAYDLGGGRVVDIIPIPGHQSAHIAVYDRRTANLITGDSLYPGRLYVFSAISGGNWTLYKASMQRLVDFTATRDLCWVLGTHIEMTLTPGVDFPIGASSHPNEHALPLTRATLQELNAAVQAMGNNPHIEVHDDFIIYPSG